MSRTRRGTQSINKLDLFFADIEFFLYFHNDHEDKSKNQQTIKSALSQSQLVALSFKIYFMGWELLWF
jgi:hypothetical protein